ncbi:MAG: hypothetical protein F4Y27_03210 [Acidimicrobiaceae bacterium]|nr:hypothetical protein [Acidimicrobiaceae bacterium]MYA73671.1 hypothetical protein [Acidimicrobiaceae bacterium]MYC41201.1 hypothetical protein [Acidimicrobiaceae bacterium]MYG55797.1 hypothetical protein [Acidimicrobiaceae bacterium]MYH88788.1 hypothetical protein [Acidimicrobiaceae bacterium]
MSRTLLTANGITVTVRDGWDVEFSELAGESPRSLVHLANFSLPVERGDYGSGAVEIMGSAGIFMVLMEFDATASSSALFSGGVMPTSLAVADFSGHTLQRRIPNQLGTQRFFVASGRPFVLYVVLGSTRTAPLLVPEVNRTLTGVSIADSSQ